MSQPVKLGRLDHMHLVVPDRDRAAQWYAETLGFERVEAYRHWWDLPGCPVHISADGGHTSLALFQEGEGHTATNGIGMGVAFVLPAEEFIAFSRALGDSIRVDGKDGKPLTAGAIVDLDLCYSYGFLDPWGHELELSTYDHEQVTQHLAAAGIKPVRYW
ncbi:MAG: VOC family protein [Pseudomonadota bacterium]